VLTIVAELGSVTAALAYTTIGSKWPQPGGLGAPITLTYSYQNMFDGALKMPNGQPLPKLLIRDSIEEALGLWAGVVPVHFVEVKDDGKFYNQGSTQYGQIRFRHIYINGPDPAPPASPIAKAQAYYPSTSQLGGDVEYDHSDPWQEVGTLPAPDILGATIHELGHSLGLGHSSDDAAAMYWIFNRFSGIGTGELHADDITGIRSVYGAGTGSVTPLLGTWQDRPIMPTSLNESQVEFINVASGQWFDPPMVSSLRYTANSGTLFSQIQEFPSGFEGLTLSVGGEVLGQFGAGQGFSFQGFAGGGVGEFVISGIDPLVDIEDPHGFPLKLAFTTPRGSFIMTAAVPEPTTCVLLVVAMLALASMRR
jgi:hypothetical protein